MPVDTINYTPEQYWEIYQPDSRADYDVIRSGLPYNPFHSCQYFVKGLPGVCKYWNGDTCTYEFENELEKPSGYGVDGECDFLGRREWCSKYDNAGEEDLSEYVCVAPCIYRSGLGKQDPNITDHRQFLPVPKEEILGYNEGKCDGKGLGRGASGEGLGLEDLFELQRVCNYYRPYDMGFGFTEPQQLIRKADGTIDLEAMIAAVMDALQKRLPHHFKVYNIRSRAQKCAYWNKDYGSLFIINPAEDGLILDGVNFDANGRLEECTCPDTASDPYCTRDTTVSGSLEIVKQVWSTDANTVICNGAKPECPCYTGEWIYCRDDRMRPGMKVSAEQLSEIRFWMRNWTSQREYDFFFEERPNPDDPTTSYIYTFDGWESLNPSDPSESVIKGTRVETCVPALPGAKEFVTDAYLEYEPVVYPHALPTEFSPAGGEKDTTTVAQVTYPTLIRDLPVIYPIWLEIIYPYITRYPFQAEFGCGEGIPDEPCVKRSCEVDYDEVSVAGTTIRNKRLICFNLSYISGVPDFLLEYGSIAELIDRRPEHKDKFFIDLENFLDEVHRQDTTGEIIHELTSDSFGLFTIGPVKLKYQELNTILVIIDLSDELDYGDQKYEYRKVDVWSQWHGGIAAQTKYDRTLEDGTAYVDGEDITITPPGTAEISMIPLAGRNPYGLTTVSGECLAVSTREVSSFFLSYNLYNYCIKKYTVPERTSENWLRLGNYGLVWVEINNVNLNYFMDWGIESAYMDVYGENNNGEIVLEESVEMIKSFPSGEHSQINIPRNAIVLEPKDGKKRWFSKYGDDASVFRVSFYYTYISNDDELADEEEIIWPNLDSESNRFSSPSVTISEIETGSDSYMDGAHYRISGIQTETPRMLCLFPDDEGALVSNVSTKLLVNIPRVFCRAVEINYSWFSAGESWRLEPAAGFTLDIEPPSSQGVISRTSTPICGDHDVTPLLQIGPMWYPYTTCERYGAYDIYLVTHFCTLPYENVPRNDMRARGVDEWIALFMGEGAPSACTPDYLYGYAHMNRPSSGSVFSGYVNIVPTVNSIFYASMGWSLPPFGNTSREYVERFFSIDRITYQSSTGGTISYVTAWMPKVIDNSDFNNTFNSSGYGITSGSFTDISQMNYIQALDISEYTDGRRYRFEEVFDVRKEPRVAYPDPVVEDDFYGSPFYCFYKFIEEDVVWAWQEKWKSIERAFNSSQLFEFLNLENPDYVFDMYKYEHRKTVSEGLHTITFLAPEFDQSDNMVVYPAIQLDDGERRYFKIVYDNYDASQVEWQDENEGAVDGSGGTTSSGSLYERTSDSDLWWHSSNIIFDEEATDDEETAISAGREIKESYDSLTEIWSKGVYNRGLIANITKDRLKYLPYGRIDWEPISFTFTPSNLGSNPCGYPSGNQKWILTDETKCVVTMKEVGCPISIRFLGLEGFHSCIDSETGDRITTYLCRPGVKVESGEYTVKEESYSLPSEEKITAQTLSLYQKELNFQPYPAAMANPKFDITITFYLPTGYGALLYSEDSFKFERAIYEDTEEKIFVWERKYEISRGYGMGDYNLNGPQEPCKPRFGFENGGIYWPSWNTTPGSVAAIDKMRSVYGGEYYPDVVSVYPGTGSSVLEKEETLQKEIYEDAYNSEQSGNLKIYKHYLPPAVESFFEDLGGVAVSLDYMFCESHKFAWENNSITLDYEEVEAWQPAGHVFAWDDTKVGVKCYERDSVRELFRTKFVHEHSGGFFEPAGNAFSAYAGTARSGYIVGKSINNRALGINSAHSGPDSYTRT